MNLNSFFDVTPIKIKTDDLFPCPFCGASKQKVGKLQTFWSSRNKYVDSYILYCGQKGCRCLGIQASTIFRAKVFWNKRKPLTNH